MTQNLKDSLIVKMTIANPCQQGTPSYTLWNQAALHGYQGHPKAYDPAHIPPAYAEGYSWGEKTRAAEPERIYLRSSTSDPNSSSVFVRDRVNDAGEPYCLHASVAHEQAEEFVRLHQGKTFAELLAAPLSIAPPEDSYGC